MSLVAALTSLVVALIELVEGRRLLVSATVVTSSGGTNWSDAAKSSSVNTFLLHGHILWAAVFTFNPYLLISINELLISIIHLLISIIHLLISIIHLLISLNMATSALFLDINK